MTHHIRHRTAAPDLTGPVRALPWADRALCAVHPEPNLWFPDRSATADPDAPEVRAKAICGHCPVIEPCRAYALADPHLSGVWGGMTERERIAMRAAARGTA